MALLVLALAVPANAAEPTFPALTSRVVDDAGIIDIPTEAELDKKLADLEAKTSTQLVVVTLKSLQGYEIEDYGYRLGRQWGIGQKKENNGALLIVAPNERAVRIEVGYGLEGTLTDAVSRLVIENAILPRFREGDFAGGISRGVDDLVQVLSGDQDFVRRAEEAQEGARATSDPADIAFQIFMFIMIAIWVSQFFRASRRRGQQMGRTGGPIFFPTGGGWSGGGGFGGSSGGGFGGGGGSFGGGGASGRW